METLNSNLMQTAPFPPSPAAKCRSLLVRGHPPRAGKNLSPSEALLTTSWRCTATPADTFSPKVRQPVIRHEIGILLENRLESGIFGVRELHSQTLVVAKYPVSRGCDQRFCRYDCRMISTSVCRCLRLCCLPSNSAVNNTIRRNSHSHHLPRNGDVWCNQIGLVSAMNGVHVL